MSATERDFSNYQLGDNVHELADGLLPEMASALGYELAEQPSEENLRGLIKHIGPSKWLQDNIELVQQRLGTSADARTLAANWVDRSGTLAPTSRSFANPEITVPDEIDAAFITGGVARWMLRRASQLVNHRIQGNKVSTVYLPVGTGAMNSSEHDLVESLATKEGREPTQREFAAAYIVPMLGSVGLKPELLEEIIGDSDKGNEIMQRFASYDALAGGTVLAVANAPSAIQTAGEYRLAAWQASADFDEEGEQLFVLADSIPVARHGESAATHQNPYTALGQIARNALFLHRNNAS